MQEFIITEIIENYVTGKNGIMAKEMIKYNLA